jgi:hypothetical protein
MSFTDKKPKLAERKPSPKADHDFILIIITLTKNANKTMKDY